MINAGAANKGLIILRIRIIVFQWFVMISQISINISNFLEGVQVEMTITSETQREDQRVESRDKLKTWCLHTEVEVKIHSMDMMLSCSIICLTIVAAQIEIVTKITTFEIQESTHKEAWLNNKPSSLAQKLTTMLRSRTSATKRTITQILHHSNNLLETTIHKSKEDKIVIHKCLSTFNIRTRLTLRNQRDQSRIRWVDIKKISLILIKNQVIETILHNRKKQLLLWIFMFLIDKTKRWCNSSSKCNISNNNSNFKWEQDMSNSSKNKKFLWCQRKKYNILNQW